MRSPADTAAAFAGIGLAHPAALARLVPAAEVAVAATLLLRPRPGAVAAIAALAAFTAVLLGAMRRAGGTAVRCGCFGSASDTEVTPVTIVRNLFLLAAATTAAATPSIRTSGAAVLAVGAAVSVVTVVLAMLHVRVVTGRLFPSAHPVGNHMRTTT